MNGLINIHKPPGMTSRQAVDHVVRASGTRRVGHAGTLDPLAEGVLVLCLGTATRLTEYVQRMVKHYRAEFILGKRSDTDDIEGQVEELVDVEMPAREAIEQAARAWVGDVEQRPPIYSAIKVKGKRAYRLARSGEVVELPARMVRIESIAVLAYEPPRLELEVVCHGGTYIRSLGRDIAESLGTGAVMSRLERTAIGGFHIGDAVEPASLTDEDSVRRHLLPLKTALADMPAVSLADESIADLRQGRTIAVDALSDESVVRHAAGVAELAAVDRSGLLQAILVRRSGGWGPRRVF